MLGKLRSMYIYRISRFIDYGNHYIKTYYYVCLPILGLNKQLCLEQRSVTIQTQMVKLIRDCGGTQVTCVPVYLARFLGGPPLI